MCAFFRHGRSKRDHRINAMSNKCNAPILPTTDLPSIDTSNKVHEKSKVRRGNVVTTCREPVELIAPPYNKFKDCSLQIPTVSPDNTRDNTKVISVFREPAEDDHTLSYNLKVYNYKTKVMENLFIANIVEKITSKDKKYTPTLKNIQKKKQKKDILLLTSRQGALYLPFLLDGTSMEGMVDTGSPVSIISEHILKNYYPSYVNLKRMKSPELSSYTGNPVHVVGTYRIPVSLEGFGNISINFVVTKERFGTLIGRREIKKFCTSMHFLATGENYLVLRTSYINKRDGNYVKVIANANSKQKNEVTVTSDTVFVAGKNYIITCPGCDIILPSLTHLKLLNKDDKKNTGVYQCLLKFSGTRTDLLGRVLLVSSLPKKYRLVSSIGLDNVEKLVHSITLNKIKIERLKVSKTCSEIAAGLPFYDYSKHIINRINEIGDNTDHDPDQLDDLTNNERLGMGTEQPIQFSHDDVIDHFNATSLPEEAKVRLIQIFLQNPLIISGNVWDIGKTTSKLNMTFDREMPKNSKIYPLNSEDTKLLRGYIDFLVFHGLARRTNEDFGCPVFLVRRKTGQQLIRVIFDLREQNQCISGSVSALMGTVISQVETLADNARLVSSIDLRQCFYSIGLSDDVIKSGYSNFLTSFGNFKLLVSSTGGSNVPRWLGEFLQENLDNCHTDGSYQPLDPRPVGWYDDHHVYTEDGVPLDHHLSNVQIFIERLGSLGFKINLAKCTFCVDLKENEIDVLGFKVGYKTIRADPNKVEAIQKMPSPRNTKELQTLLGSVNFIKNLIGLKGGHAIAVLNKKLGNGKLLWDTEAEENFILLKQNLVNLIINRPRQDSINIIFSDASNFALGAVLFNVPICRLNERRPPLDWDFRAVTDESLLESLLSNNLAFLQQLDSNKNLLSLLTIVYNMHNCATESEEFVIKTLCHDVLINIKENSIGVETATNKDYYNHIGHGAYTGKNCLPVQCDNLLLKAFSRLMNRQIHFVNIGTKHACFKIGKPTVNTPIFLSFCNEIFYFLGSRVPFLCYGASNTRMGKKPTNEEIVRGFYKILRGSKLNEDYELHERVLVGGYMTKTLTKLSLSKSSYEKEALALYGSLVYFKDYIQTVHTIVCTDNSPCFHIFTRAGQLKNRKILSLNLKIITEFPGVGIVLVEGKKMLGDFLSRIQSKEEECKNVFPVCSGNPGQDGTVKYFATFSRYFDFLENLMLQGIAHDSEIVSREETVVNFLKINISNALFEKYLCLENVANHTLSFKESFQGKPLKLKENKMGLLLDPDTMRVFCPPSLEMILISKFHSQRGHKTSGRLYSDINNYYVFANKAAFRQKINILTESCLACKTTRPNLIPAESGTQFLDLTYPGQAVSLDFMETENISTSAHLHAKKFLIILDHFSGKVSVYPTSSSTSKDTVLSFLAYLCENPVPETVLTDNATSFTGTKFLSLLKLFGIKRTESSPRKSTARSSVENCINLLRTQIRLMSSLEPTINIAVYMPLAVKILNNSPRSDTLYTPQQIYTKNLTVTRPSAFLKHRANTYGPDDNFGYTTQPSRQVLKKVRGELNRLIRDVMSKTRKTKLQRQTKRNLHKVKVKSPAGTYVLPRSFPSSNLSNAKMRDKYSRVPHIVLKEYSHAVIVKNIVTDQVIQRAKSDIKVLYLTKIKALELPQDILDSLDFMTLADFEPLQPSRIKPNVPEGRMDSSDSDDDEEKGITFLTPF